MKKGVRIMKEKLAYLLETKGMKPIQLARESGLGASAIYDILNGRLNDMKIGIDKAIKIAETLGVTVEYLYDLERPAVRVEVSETTIAGESVETLDIEVPPCVPAGSNAQQFVDRFSALSAEGQIKVLAYIDDLAASGKY